MKLELPRSRDATLYSASASAAIFITCVESGEFHLTPRATPPLHMFESATPGKRQLQELRGTQSTSCAASDVPQSVIVHLQGYLCGRSEVSDGRMQLMVSSTGSHDLTE